MIIIVITVASRNVVEEASSVSPSEHLRELVRDHLPDHHTSADWATAPLYHDTHLKTKVDWISFGAGVGNDVYYILERWPVYMLGSFGYTVPQVSFVTITLGFRGVCIPDSLGTSTLCRT